MANLPEETEEPPHDVLAADEFAVPAGEALRHRGPVVLPEDPTGDSRPHDVLAAEEFAMPAPSSRPFGSVLTSRRGGAARLAVEVAALLVLIVLLLRRRG